MLKVIHQNNYLDGTQAAVDCQEVVEYSNKKILDLGPWRKKNELIETTFETWTSTQLLFSAELIYICYILCVESQDMVFTVDICWLPSDTNTYLGVFFFTWRKLTRQCEPVEKLLYTVWRGLVQARLSAQHLAEQRDSRQNCPPKHCTVWCWPTIAFQLHAFGVSTPNQIKCG